VLEVLGCELAADWPAIGAVVLLPDGAAEVAAALVSPAAAPLLALVLGVAEFEEVELGQVSAIIFTLVTLMLPLASVAPVISTI
jgi:hypothetical protein